MAEAKVTICDRCGEVLKFACDCRIKMYIHAYGDQNFDLCEKCTQKLRLWLARKEDK